MEYLKTIWHWLVKSSADPRATSLTVKSTLLGGLTLVTGHVVQALDLVCTFGYKCYYLDPSLIDELRLAIDAIAEGFYYALMLVAIGGTIVGAVRKIVRTLKGTNHVLQ